MTSSIEFKGSLANSNDLGTIRVVFDQAKKTSQITFDPDAEGKPNQTLAQDTQVNLQLQYKTIEHVPCCFDSESADGPSSYPVEKTKTSTVYGKLKADAQTGEVTLSHDNPNGGNSSLVSFLKGQAPKESIVAPQIRDSYHESAKFSKDLNNDGDLDSAFYNYNVTEGGSSTFGTLTFKTK